MGEGGGEKKQLSNHGIYLGYSCSGYQQIRKEQHRWGKKDEKTIYNRTKVVALDQKIDEINSGESSLHSWVTMQQRD